MQNRVIMDFSSGIMDRDQRIRKIMDNYNSGNEELRQQSMAGMINELDGFIRERVAKSSNYTNEFEDIVSECKCEVLSEMKNYSPEKGAPTTYFYFVIKHAISYYNNTHYNKSSQHFSQIANRVRTATRILIAKGIEHPTPGMIAVQAGLTVKQVQDGLSIIHGANEKFISESEGTREYLAMYTKSTEDDYIKREEKNMWRRAMSELDERAVRAFTLFHGIDAPPKTCSEIAKIIGVPQKDVKRMVEHTRRYLARNRAIREHYHIKDGITA